MKERVEDAIEESMMHWHAHIMDSVLLETARNQRLKSVIQGSGVLDSRVQGDPSGSSKHPVDFTTKVSLWHLCLNYLTGHPVCDVTFQHSHFSLTESLL